MPRCFAVVDAILALVTAFQPAGRRARGWLIALGIVGLIAGFFVIFRPISSTIAFAWFMGMWLTIRGIVSLISVFGPVINGSRWMIGIRGVLFIIAGIVFIANPGGAALGFAVMLGVLALSWGFFQLIGGMRIRREAKQAADA